jgi:inward rectifier potassium channel
MSWSTFFALTVGLYLVSNLFFAVAYLVGGDNIANATPGSLVDTFFFSVQTMATIGYGALYPKTVYANVLVTIEALTGLLGVAMITGLMFARFSRPSARVLFSKVAVIAPHNGVPMLIFRAANRRSNQIVEARMWVTLARDEVTEEGEHIRRIYDLRLIRNHTPLFFLTWTAFHPIDENSPLYGETAESLREAETIIFVILTGIDETVTQTVHARHTFSMDEIHWNKRFVDVFCRAPDGRRAINYSYFHDIEPLPGEE